MGNIETISDYQYIKNIGIVDNIQTNSLHQYIKKDWEQRYQIGGIENISDYPD